MRGYILASLALHLALLATGNWLAMQSAREVPTFDTIRVDLATLPLPTPEPPSEREPEPEPVPPPPAEMLAAPPELDLEPAPPTPPEPTRDLVPPDPSLPEPPPERDPEPTPPPEPPAQQLPEPEVVKPEPPREPRRDPAPDRTPSELGERAGEEAMAADAAVDLAAPAGVDDYYLALIRRKIGRRWEPSRAAARGRSVECVVAFRIGPAGDILAPEVARSSGLSVFDRAALRAVISSNPLPPPPPRFPAGFPVEFIFVYRP